MHPPSGIGFGRQRSGQTVPKKVLQRGFRITMVFEKTPGGFAVTIAERGRGDESVSTAEVFTWSELPELLAAEDLFEGAGASGALEVRNARVGVLARVDDDEDDFREVFTDIPE